MLDLRPTILALCLSASVSALGCSTLSSSKVNPQTQETARPANITQTPSQSDSLLLESVKGGDARAVERHLSGGADPNSRDGNGFPALVAATASGNKEIIRLLIGAGADVNAVTRDTGRTALMVGLELNDRGVVSLLLEHGASVDIKQRDSETTALHMAARAGDAEMLNALLPHSRMVDVKDGAGDTPLMIAARDVEIVKILIEKGADVNARNNLGQTPLALAIGSVKAVRLLVEHGADVNAVDADNWSPLQEAMLSGCSDEILLLQRAGARE